MLIKFTTVTNRKAKEWEYTKEDMMLVFSNPETIPPELRSDSTSIQNVFIDEKPENMATLLDLKKKLSIPFEMREFDVTCRCTAIYNSYIMVPKYMSHQEALKYAAEHIDEIPLYEMEYVKGSDELDEENCSFSDDEQE